MGRGAIVSPDPVTLNRLPRRDRGGGPGSTHHRNGGPSEDSCRQSPGSSSTRPPSAVEVPRGAVDHRQPGLRHLDFELPLGGLLRQLSLRAPQLPAPAGSEYDRLHVANGRETWALPPEGNERVLARTSWASPAAGRSAWPTIGRVAVAACRSTAGYRLQPALDLAISMRFREALGDSWKLVAVGRPCTCVALEPLETGIEPGLASST